MFRSRSRSNPQPQISQTRLLAATPESITIAAAALRIGELVAFPTETVYGLGANALDEKAVARIFTAKGRPPTDPLIVHVTDREGLRQVVTVIPPLADRLIAMFWPGALTLILPRADLIPANVSAGLSTVAVRAPSHPVAQALIRAARVPIVAPSANRFAHVSPTSAAHVMADLNGRIGWILDGGATPIGIESTIVDLSGDQPVLRRPGAIGLDALRDVITDLILPAPGESRSDSTPQIAPGQSAVHYAPNAPMTVFDGDPGAVQRALRSALTDALAAYAPESIGLLIAAEDRSALADLIDHSAIRCITLGRLNDLDTVAGALYAGLRELDVAQVAIILARQFPPDGIGLALRDRLSRAAGGHVIAV